MQQASGCCLAAMAAVQGCSQQGGLVAFDLFVEVGATLRQQDGFVAGDAVRQQAGGQMAFANLFAAHSNHQPLNEVLELTDVAGPVVLLKDGKGVWREPLDGHAIGAAVGLQEIVAE